MHRVAALAVAIILALSFAGVVRAQSTSASITGRVTDPQKALIVGATVAAINAGTNVRYEGATNKTGEYYVTNLPPGTYRIEVERAGFKSVIKPDVVLHVQDAIEINFELTLGSVSETVTVEAGGLNINTTDGSVSTVVDQSYVQNMPLNGRSFQDLILLTPGIVTQSPQTGAQLGQQGEFSVNGQRTEANNYTVDGVSGNVGATAGTNMTIYGGASGSLSAATSMGTTQALVSVDALQEFRVQSSTYSAEFGRNPGGQFAFETKSGTNEWHGTAYDFVRNGVLDAPDWFNDYFGLSEPPLRQNDFGGTFGGPAEVPGLYYGKDKTFFFVSYEGLRLAAPQAANASYVPDAALRASAPPALQQVMNAFPVQSSNGIDDTVNGIAQFIGSWSTPASLDSTSVRFDHVVNDKVRLFFRFSDTASSSTTRGTAANNGTPTQEMISAYTMRTYTGGASSAISSRLSNEFRINFTSNESDNRQVIDAFGGSTPVNLAQLSGLVAGSRAMVALEYGGYFVPIGQQQQSGAQRQWNLVDTVSLSLGRHQFKFGIDYRRLVPFAISATPSVSYFYEDEPAVTNNNAFTYLYSQAPAYPLFTTFSAFAQDEWRVTQRMSLSLGLRWEVNPAPGVSQGLQAYTVQGTSPDTWTLAPQGTSLWRTTWYNFAPRLGLAYILHNASGREMVLRIGSGVFFDTGQQLGAFGFADGPGFFGSNSLSAPFPVNAPALAPTLTNPPAPPFDVVTAFAPHLQLPYTVQWNASIEQALGKSQAISVSYVGSHGARLLQLNAVIPPNNPNVFYAYVIKNGLTSDYDSLQVQFRRKLSQGLTALASYTWSHCIDYGSQNYLLEYERGNCDFDLRHNLSAAFSYDLPNVGHNAFGNAVLHHWGLDDRFTARTSFPVILNGNAAFDPTGQQYNEGLNLVPDQPVYLYGANCNSTLQGLGDLAPGQVCPGGRAINPNAFSNVNSGLGDAPRNFARGFGAWQMNLAIRRDFPIRERLKVQFRAEAFNIFNHPNFGTINPNFGEPTFGQATATLASSLGVLNPLYQQGGSRSMQFALKIVF